MELFAADGHDAGGCERVTGKSGMRPKQPLMRVQPEDDGDRVLLDAPLPDTQRGRDTAVMVRAGTYTGLSAEVQVHADRTVGGRREIERAELVGAAVVDTPAIRSATVTVHEKQRQRRRRVWL